MISLSSYLPQSQGLLPKWLFFIAGVSIFNSAQCYLAGVKLNRRIYSNKPQEVTKLCGRMFGTWTLITSIIRLYASYKITDPTAYHLAFATYLVAAWHFFSEWLIFRSANLERPLFGPLIVASTTIIWMLAQWNYYLPM